MGDTGGHLGWAFVLLVLGPLLAFVVRRRWRNATARAEEVQRLALLAAAEAERAEMEAVREYTVSIMHVTGWIPQPPSVVYDYAPSPSMPSSSTCHDTAAFSRMVDENTGGYQESASVQNTTEMEEEEGEEGEEEEGGTLCLTRVQDRGGSRGGRTEPATPVDSGESKKPLVRVVGFPKKKKKPNKPKPNPTLCLSPSHADRKKKKSKILSFFSQPSRSRPVSPLDPHRPGSLSHSLSRARPQVPSAPILSHSLSPARRSVRPAPQPSAGC